jgi:hypothetical protein
VTTKELVVSVQLPPLFADTCHWTSGVGLPEPAADSVTYEPKGTLSLSGSSMIVGAVPDADGEPPPLAAFVGITPAAPAEIVSVDFEVVADPAAFRNTARYSRYA